MTDEVEISPGVNGTSTFSCSECGRTFGSVTALGGHRSSAHIHVGMETCPECGEKRRAGVGMTNHLRLTHGINRAKGKKSTGRPRGRPRKMPSALTAPHRDPLRAEEIIQATCTILWPDGVPPGKLEAVLKWHQQTTTFLDLVLPSPE